MSLADDHLLAYLACSSALPEDRQYNEVPETDASTVGGAGCLPHDAYLACSSALPEDRQYNVVPETDASTVGGASCLPNDHFPLMSQPGLRN